LLEFAFFYVLLQALNLSPSSLSGYQSFRLSSSLLAVRILIQVFFNSALAYWLNRAVGEKHNIACPSALICASNFFELAVAAAISLFGFNSGAELATVVGVLIEVPVMFLVVHIVNNSKSWYEGPSSTPAN
jgi:ACR3 family arsenite transporter